MSQGTPRKFSEKIAIMERKQNEDQEAFTSIMRDVRSITSNSQQRTQPVTTSLAPPLVNRNSTSLPSVFGTDYYWPVQQPLQQPLQFQQQPQPAASPPHRSRSPGAVQHYHPYNKPQIVQERTPPVDYNRPECSPQHLQLPESQWPKAKSDPAIHNFDEIPMSQSFNEMMLSQANMQQLQQLPQVSQVQQQIPQVQQFQQVQSAQMQQETMRQSQIRFQQQLAASQQQQQQQQTSSMYISPPQRRPEECLGTSLPNMMSGGPPPPPYNCHQPISQRHSMGICQTLTTPQVMTESLSAPTSPQQMYDMNPPPNYPARNYSTSPEPMAPIPNIVLTGTDGSFDGFRELRDLGDVPLQDISQDFQMQQQIQQIQQIQQQMQQMQPQLPQLPPGFRAVGVPVTGDARDLKDLRMELQNCEIGELIHANSRIDPKYEPKLFN